MKKTHRKCVYMANKYHKEKQKNIDTLIGIRDSKDTAPVVRIQAVRTMQKLIDEDHPEFKRNMNTLLEIRDDERVKASIRVMAMQSLNSMFDIAGDTADDDSPTEADIMAKIRKGSRK